MLTKKQRDLLLFIHERMQGGDIAPSFDEMREALGLKSKSGIHRLITALVERGYLERLPHRARALEVSRLPEGYATPSQQDTASPSLQVIQGGKPDNAPSRTPAPHIDEIPLYGRIAAGTPIEAIRDEGTHIPVPPGMTGPGEHYALEVSGDSMTGIGINDGDTVIIRRGETANDGAIIVALVDGEEVTLKRLKRENGKVVLIPENPAYDPRILNPDQVRIQGTLAALLRTYH